MAKGMIRKVLGLTVIGAIVGGSIASYQNQADKAPTPVAKAQPKVQAAKVQPKPELTAEEKKQKAFEDTRSTYGYVLTALIKKSAFDPDALKINRPEYFKNGVCVSANGKNRFGAYVGFQDYCYLVDDTGNWKYSGPG